MSKTCGKVCTANRFNPLTFDHRLKFMRNLLLWVILLGVFFGCKVTKPQLTDSAPVEPVDTVDTVTIEVKPTEVLVQEEVDLPVSRFIPKSVSIVGVGDIMTGTQFPNSSYLPPHQGEDLWTASASIIQSADIAFGNLEGTILDGVGEPKECNNPDACYLFKMPVSMAYNLRESGFDLLSMANNHANDFGPAGRQSTLNTLDSLGIQSAGSIERPYVITKINHLRVGFIAFAPNKGTLNFHNTDYALSLIRHLDSLSDLVIVSIHGGAEGEKNIHVTREIEYYYGENRGNIYAFSHQLIDAGADVIFGHGPHVPRAIELYRDRFIAYSLGNFCTYGRFNLKGKSGEAPLIRLETHPDGQFISGQLYAFRQSYADGPRLDPSGTVIQTIQKLSREDFPENPIDVDDQGRIVYIQN